ncbi:hypothetical protein FIBSPDRAFT_899537 [Athelia psychrophila]|uniref:Uncharacterized protein n=1 Tax=Athelia psychrophila TaxID=1759441 RepID=A0A165ZKA0_9AGAM|nr:hypothetical protein FIBSPDRAFT_899537 [Fibularhizoctonia sp. CBS 109695]
MNQSDISPISSTGDLLHSCRCRYFAGKDGLLCSRPKIHTCMVKLGHMNLPLPILILFLSYGVGIKIQNKHNTSLKNGPVTFHYKRRAWVGSVGDGCGIVGDSMPIKIRRRMEEEGDDYNPAQDKDLGPKRIIHHHLCDFVNSHEEDEEEGGCENPLNGPDLPGQHRQGPNGIDGAFLEKGRGWQGPYVRKLLKKKKREQPLGERPIKTQWTYDQQWAIGVGFKALDVYLAEKDDEDEDEYEYDDEGPALDGYKVEATIQRIVLTAAFLQELQEPGSGDDSRSSSSIVWIMHGAAFEEWDYGVMTIL